MTMGSGGRRTPDEISDEDLGKPPAPAVPLEQKPEFRAEVAKLHEIWKAPEVLPAAQPSEKRVYAEVDAPLPRREKTQDLNKVAIAAVVDPRRAVTAKLPREPKATTVSSSRPPPAAAVAVEKEPAARRWGVTVVGAALVVAAAVVALLFARRGGSKDVPAGEPPAGDGSGREAPAPVQATAVPVQPTAAPSGVATQAATPSSVVVVPPGGLPGRAVPVRKPKSTGDDPYDAPPRSAKTAEAVVPQAPGSPSPSQAPASQPPPAPVSTTPFEGKPVF